MREPGFTCLIPAYNEADRIGSVLSAVMGHPDLARVIVIDDGSTDQTAAIALQSGAEVLATGGNRGKTGALLCGLKAVRTSHVVLIDADLIGLTGADLSALIAPIGKGAGATISLRGNAPRTWRRIGLDYISGERVIPVDLLAGHEAALQALPRFGFEVYLNRLLIAEKLPLAVVPWPKVASPSKASKRGFVAGVLADIAMMRDIFRTIPPHACLGQIAAMRRLRLPQT